MQKTERFENPEGFPFCPDCGSGICNAIRRGIAQVLLRDGHEPDWSSIRVTGFSVIASPNDPDEVMITDINFQVREARR